MAPPSKTAFHHIVLRCRCEGDCEEWGEEILRRGRRCGDEFIAGDFRRNAHAAVPGGLDAHNLSLTADIYVAGLSDLLGKSDHEFDFAANFEIGVSDKVQPAETDRSEEHTSELQSPDHLVCRLLLEKKKKHIQHIDRN